LHDPPEGAFSDSRSLPNEEKLTFMQMLRDMAALIARHAPDDGITQSSIDRLSLMRSARPTKPTPVLYEPALSLVAQGRKQAVLAGRIFVYEPARYLIVNVDLPVVGYVCEASPEEPYLAMALRFDPVVLGEMVMHTPPASDLAPPALGLTLCDAEPTLLDAAIRLLRLLDEPKAANVLAPLLHREILYRLLMGPYGPSMRQMAAAHGRTARVSRAIGWIKTHVTERLSIEALAAEAGMSESSLHEHFKAVTAMSPLQYQKQLRLQEARRLMLANGMDAATVAFRVGYESPSQFSREYRRLFGAPPAADVTRIRSAPEMVMVA
jgi:AraC-like DNA-binding protein